MTTTDTSVAVLGNGPVGQTAALLLARWGVPVVLLDQRPCRDRVGSKAIVHQRDVLDVWQAVGAGRRIADEGLTWTTARTFHRDRELFSYSFAGSGRSAFPPFVNLSQGRAEQILDERIAAEPMVDVRWGHRVTDLTQDPHGVTMSCATGRGEVTVRAAYVVACAGARGDDVRNMLGVTFAGHSFNDRFLICDIRTDLAGWASERRFYFDPPWNPGRQVLLLLLAADGVDVPAARAAAGHVAPAPVRVLGLADVDHTGALAEALSARPGELWVIRPDAHVAAVLTNPDDGAVTRALRRALGAAVDPVARQADEPGAPQSW